MTTNLFSRPLKATLAALALATIAATGHTSPTIANGGFETNALASGGFLTDAGATGWTTTSGYTFLAQDTAPTVLGGPALWQAKASPVGGWFLAADGAFLPGITSTTVTGLVAGQAYSLSYWQAAGQQTGNDGETTEWWDVRADGGDWQRSTVMHNPSHGFVDWMQQTMTFTATGATATLDFFAGGTPLGLPPYSLLDGVTVTEKVPEPGALALMGVGLLALVRSRRRSNKSS